MANLVQVRRDGDVAWVTVDNPPVNATSTAVREGLLTAVAAVQGAALAVLSCTGRTFIAGGDISEFDAPPRAPHLPDVVDAIERSPTPFAAALHGTVLGGGFEIAMACAHRIAALGTRFGLPEVNLGLIPGAGGTQRGPRLLGWQMAFEMACLGQMKTAEDLLTIGAIDQIADDPTTAALAYIGKSPAPPVSARPTPPLLPAQKAGFAAKVQEIAKGRDAPMHTLEALQWAEQPFAIGQPKERARHLDLRASPQSKALRHVFAAERAATKPAALQQIPPMDIARVVVVGGGLMGSGIAAACLNAGLTVTVIEQSTQAADAAQATVTGLLSGAVKRGKMTGAQMADRLGQAEFSTDYAKATEADLAIEAVFEDVGAKRAVFAQLAQTLRADALLATNTSYLNPTEIFQGLPNPERCLGLHFFSPAHIMKLVEVIATNHTSPTALATGFAVARRMGKTPVLAGVCDGFIGNRILAAYRRAAEYMLVDHALRPHDIDGAMRAFGMAMGPFEAQDAAGLQVAEANRRRQDATRPRR